MPACMRTSGERVRQATQFEYNFLLRYFLLAGLLTFLSYQFYAHAMGDKLFPSVHGLCPFGGLESLLSFVTVGATLKKIFSGTMVLFFTFLLLALIFNRAFCGLICSFGAIQEFIGNLGRRLFRRRFLVPSAEPLLCPARSTSLHRLQSVLPRLSGESRRRACGRDPVS
ncbi:MAG: 4Fe-4S binding protein [Clostridia bacterium]|nr:4Fe-4S binding protein [Clostridia bacterium]